MSSHKERATLWTPGMPAPGNGQTWRHEGGTYYVNVTDEYVPKPTVGFIGDNHSGGIVINGEDVGLNGIDTRKACEIADKIRAALHG